MSIIKKNERDLIAKYYRDNIVAVRSPEVK
jgi:hypothetical protein